MKAIDSNSNKAAQKDTLYDNIDEVISSLLAALFGMYFSSEFIGGNTIEFVIIRVVALISSFFVLKYIISKWRKWWRTHRELKDYSKKKTSSQYAFDLIGQFNNKSSDYIDSCHKNLEEYDALPYQCNLMRINKLMCAFEQINGLLSITVEIINYKDLCINNPTIANGIPVYKIRNVYNYICEVLAIVDKEKVIIDSTDIEEFDKDINLAKIELNKITTFLTQTQNS